MTKTKVGVLTALGTAIVMAVLVVLVAAGLKWFSDGLGRTELLRTCEYDATASGKQGYCVVVSRYPATPVHSERTSLEIAPVYDGTPLDLRFSANYPFYAPHAGDRLEIDWSRVNEQITVTDPATASRITYTVEQYGDSR